MKNTIAVLLPLFLIILAATGCRKPASNYLIKVGAAPSLSNAATFIAKEQGYFDELGLSVEISIFKGSGAPQTVLLTSGKLDVGGGGFSTGLWKAINGGMDIKLVACKSFSGKEQSHWSLLVRKDHVESGKYRDFKDLKGFRMTLPSLGGSGPEVIHDLFLKAGGLEASDVEVIKASYAEMNVCLSEKTIDATAQVEPFATKAVLDGVAERAAMASDVYPDMQGAAIFYSPLFVKDHKPLAQKYMQAYLKGVRDFHMAFFKGKEKKKIIAMLKKYVRIEDDEIWEKSIPCQINPDGYLKRDSIEYNIKWYLDKGYIEKAPDLDSIIDHSFVEHALQKIGKFKG